MCQFDTNTQHKPFVKKVMRTIWFSFSIPF